MRTNELVDASCTRLLHETPAYRVYCTEGVFETTTIFDFNSDLLGIFACLRGTMHSGSTELNYQLNQQLVSFAFRHRCEKVVPAGTDLQVVFLLFPLSTIEDVLRRMGTPVTVALERFTSCACTVAYSNQEILRAVSRLYKETTDRYPGFEVLADTALTEVLVHFLRLFADERQDGAVGREGFVVSQLKAYLAENSHRRITIDEVTRYTGYAKSQLSKLFKQATGQTIVQYVNALRVDEACRLIREHDGAIEDVAYKVGFQNLNHFYKTFKKVTGSLPSAYREGLLT